MVSILIQAHNAEATIARAVRSVRSQTSASIILADDHSTDRTVAIALDVGGPQLRVVRPDTRWTVAAVRQTALAAATTPLAVWLDADDELLPGRVGRLIRVLEHEPCDFVWDAAEIADGQPRQRRHLVGVGRGHTRISRVAQQPGRVPRATQPVDRS